MHVSIRQLNQMDQAHFVELLGTVFEETPSIAEQVWSERPFENVSELHQKMVTIVEHMSLAEKLSLINAHPQLGSKHQMAAASVQEQASAELDHISQPTYQRLRQLNMDYQKRFGFPFVMAIKGQTREAILTEFEKRLHRSPEAELKQALLEIAKIARLRLNDLIE